MITPMCLEKTGECVIVGARLPSFRCVLLLTADFQDMQFLQGAMFSPPASPIAVGRGAELARDRKRLKA